jgi:hypothetical protein
VGPDTTPIVVVHDRLPVNEPTTYPLALKLSQALHGERFYKEVESKKLEFERILNFIRNHKGFSADFPIGIQDASGDK